MVGPKPYPLTPYDYVVNIDLTTPVSFESAEDRGRYGGTIVTPEKIHPDATITIHLNDDTTLKETDRIRMYTGVRDDPFIFPRFFKVNVISMVATSCVPTGNPPPSSPITAAVPIPSFCCSHAAQRSVGATDGV